MARGEDVLLSKIPVISPPSEAEVSSARRVVCAAAIDSADAATLLRMLGLL